jgi:hypothetical protein
MDNMAKWAILTEMKSAPEPIDPILGGLPAFEASTVKNKFGEVTRRAAQGAIAIHRYRRPELVILPAADYLRLEKARRAPLDQLSGQFDALVARMRTTGSRKAVQALFGAGPADLGRAAVKAAKAHGR